MYIYIFIYIYFWLYFVFFSYLNAYQPFIGYLILKSDVFKFLFLEMFNVFLTATGFRLFL